MSGERTLQDGIYYDRGERPGDAFGMLFLRAADGASATDVGGALGDLWTLWQGLRRGEVPGLEGLSVPTGNLTALVGFGVKLFELPGARRPTPQGLGPSTRFRSPRPEGGGPLLRGGGLHYDAGITANHATEEVAVQLVADTELAVHRAVVETTRLLRTRPALQVAAFSRGFQRDDARSWIGFHDGISNLRSGDQRAGAITIGRENAAAPDDAWTIGGTYLSFLRITIDLALWDGIDVATQERLVGRDKRTGAALASLGADGQPLRQAGCPVAGTQTVADQGNERFREPPPVSEPALRATHVQRANQHRGPIEEPGSLRLYRQGYEFLDATGPDVIVGLNFVSFQDSIDRVTRVLTQPDWLGGVNFGGGAEGLDDPELLHVQAAGVYLVPPRAAGDGLPGGEVLGVAGA